MAHQDKVPRFRASAQPRWLATLGNPMVHLVHFMRFYQILNRFVRLFKHGRLARSAATRAGPICRRVLRGPTDHGLRLRFQIGNSKKVGAFRAGSSWMLLSRGLVG